MDFSNRDIISITDFRPDEILHLCSKGNKMFSMEKSGKRNELSNSLKGRALAYMFYEPSTRTRTSFNTAMRELGGTFDGFSGAEGTSVMKKETIADTIMMQGANHFDVVVMRHPLDGSLQWAADAAQIPVINGGDGKNEHPTQALLDLLSIYMLNNKKFDNLNIGFGGDLAHGRTVRSLGLALSHFDNITIRWAADDFFAMPIDLIESLEARRAKVIREKSVKDVLKSVQFYYMTRPQLERIKNRDMGELLGMIEESRITKELADGFHGKLMHPLPVDSMLAEIAYDAYFRPCQSFFLQAECGIFMRKALLYEILHNDDYILFNGKLPAELERGNNRIRRRVGNKPKKGRFIDNIANGTVLDHLQREASQKIAAELGIVSRGHYSVAADIPKSGKSFLKTDLGKLTEREFKKIALISPDSTVNHIADGHVADKFVYLLCKNDNCVSRVVNEDVPPKFYDDGEIRCRYCRRPYSVENKKVSEEELESFRKTLPKSIIPVGN